MELHLWFHSKLCLVWDPQFLFYKIPDPHLQRAFKNFPLWPLSLLICRSIYDSLKSLTKSIKQSGSAITQDNQNMELIAMIPF